MVERVDSNEIEAIVGRERHPSWHFGRAVSEEQKFYILHSQRCLDSGEPLEDCAYSKALALGIEPEDWVMDKPVELNIVMGWLTMARYQR